MDCSPPGCSVPGILQARITGVGCHALLQGIFLTPGSNRCLLHLLHRQAGSLPLAPRPDPICTYKYVQFPFSIFEKVYLLGVCGFPHACNAGDLGSIPGLGRSPGNDNPLQYSSLENPMDRGVWYVIVHGVAKSQRRQRDLTFFFFFHLFIFLANILQRPSLV